MDFGLAGRHCFVTGASAASVAALRLRSAREGALRSIAGRDESALAATREMIVAQGASVLGIIACDLSDPSGIDAAAVAIARAERPVRSAG
jgi:NAD(P)-dependent dehydrogenase (short-subunit alcohol dehydrogenase family)